LDHLDSDFQKHLDLLKRGTLNEDEFNKANLSIREERAALKAKCQELEEWLRVLAQRGNREGTHVNGPGYST